MESPSGKIFSFLCRYPTREFAYREIERGTGVSVATVSRNVKGLEEKGLIKTRKTTNAIFVSAALDNDHVIQMKRVRNLESLYTSGLVDHLLRILRPDVLVLFGSYSRGYDQEDSDIDIAVICGRENESDLKMYEEGLARTISLTRITDMENVSNEFKNTLANGIILSGSLEVV